MQFPEVTGNNLNGTEYDLPDDFEDGATLAVIAFFEEQQPTVNTWLELAAELAETVPGFSYYELPVIEASSPAVRAFIDRGMAAGIPDAAARRRTVTLYVSKADFCRALELPGDDSVYALLLDATGEVRWRASGARTPETEAGLRTAVDRLLGTD